MNVIKRPDRLQFDEDLVGHQLVGDKLTDDDAFVPVVGWAR
jgi:hypothetical protein